MFRLLQSSSGDKSNSVNQYNVECSSGHSTLPAPLWLSARDDHGYDSDDEQYLDAELDLQRRASTGEVLRELSSGRRSFW